MLPARGGGRGEGHGGTVPDPPVRQGGAGGDLPGGRGGEPALAQDDDRVRGGDPAEPVAAVPADPVLHGGPGAEERGHGGHRELDARARARGLGGAAGGRVRGDAFRVAAVRLPVPAAEYEVSCGGGGRERR